MINNMILGSQLAAEDQQIVLAHYVHRFTGEHKPSWAHKPWMDSLPYPVQFASDSEWLANTLFMVRRDGRLDSRCHHCESSPTWPNNPELRK